MIQQHFATTMQYCNVSVKSFCNVSAIFLCCMDKIFKFDNIIYYNSTIFFLDWICSLTMSYLKNFLSTFDTAFSYWQLLSSTWENAVPKNFEKILRTLWEENKQFLFLAVFCKVDTIWVKNYWKSIFSDLFY